MGAGPLLVIAAGGTGGHMFPAQALAEEMGARGWRVALMTDPRGARYAAGFPRAVARVALPAASPGRGGAVHRLAAPVLIGAGMISALVWMLARRPAAVAGFGGYPSLPALAAAWVLRRPRLIHEQNGVLGRVNRAFARRVALVACGTWPADLPEGATGAHVGNPVRAAVHARIGAPYVPPGREGMVNLLVLGGSQGARILSDVVPAALAELPESLRARLRLTHQARAEDVERIEAALAAIGASAEVAPFFADVPDRMADAQLVVARAGASTLAEIAAIGRPAILIPYPAATGDHQAANAAALVRAGAAEMIREGDLSPARLAAAIRTVLEDPARAEAVAAAARAAGRPDAARDLADRIEALAGRR